MPKYVLLLFALCIVIFPCAVCRTIYQMAGNIIPTEIRTTVVEVTPFDDEQHSSPSKTPFRPYPTYTRQPTYTPYPTYTPQAPIIVTATPDLTETAKPTNTITSTPTKTRKAVVATSCPLWQINTPCP